MKKLFGLILGLFLTTAAYADIVSYTTLSSDAGVGYTHLNNSFTTLYNDYNGNISTLNIKANTISDDDMATSVKPSNFISETIGDFTYTGMLPPTSASLTAITTAGTSYVSGFRVVTDATSKTYTASRDTYVYIDKNGAFQYQEVANGGATPTTPSNSLLLAKVVTNGTAVTSVTDSRQMQPSNLRIYQDLKSGAVISRDITTATKISIDVGEIEFGASVTSGRRRNTSPIYINFAGTGRGGLDTGTQQASTYYYIFALADDDNSTNWEGIASTSATDASGVTGERLIGWCYTDTASIISSDSVGAYRGLGGDAPNIVMVKKENLTTVLGNGLTQIVPTIRFYSSGRPTIISYSFAGDSGAGGSTYGVLSIDSIAIQGSESGFILDAARDYVYSAAMNYPTTLSRGTHNIQMKVWTDTSTFNLHNYNIIVEEK